MELLDKNSKLWESQEKCDIISLLLTIMKKMQGKERKCLVYVSQFWVHILQLWDIIVEKKIRIARKRSE